MQSTSGTVRFGAVQSIVLPSPFAAHHLTDMPSATTQQRPQLPVPCCLKRKPSRFGAPSSAGGGALASLAEPVESAEFRAMGFPAAALSSSSLCCATRAVRWVARLSCHNARREGRLSRAMQAGQGVRVPVMAAAALTCNEESAGSTACSLR